jgi:hypothetical protein
MDDENDRAIEIEFAVVTLFIAGAFIAGLVAAARYLLG